MKRAYIFLVASAEDAGLVRESLAVLLVYHLANVTQAVSLAPPAASPIVKR